MKQLVLSIAAALALSMVGVDSAHAAGMSFPSSGGVTVTKVEVNPLGVLFEVSSTINMSGCGTGKAAYLYQSSSAMWQQQYQMLLSAFLSGRQVRFWIPYCSTINNVSYPIVNEVSIF